MVPYPVGVVDSPALFYLETCDRRSGVTSLGSLVSFANQALEHHEPYRQLKKFFRVEGQSYLTIHRVRALASHTRNL